MLNWKDEAKFVSGLTAGKLLIPTSPVYFGCGDKDDRDYNPRKCSDSRGLLCMLRNNLHMEN